MTTTADDVWRLLGELIAAQKETERILREERQETERRFQETERILREQSQETERILREQSQETERKIQAVNKQVGNLSGKWGLFVENMVAPACETLFLNRGIPVHQASQRMKRTVNNQTLEIDVLVSNENHVLAVEVKSTLRVDDIKEFIEDLQQFKQFFPEYNQKQLYGAVAGIEIESGADKYAYRQGLFVLAQSGESVSILNDDQFEPTAW
ncbi:conserved hypothetical protein [Rippkaea orientalis PCC 8801]|uniref:DUF3782 domain-containing protein n=1 Tax=Rippkaea orientalis (strain PCC 8801 / RF-1) TaxID=41431 RepID=B7K5B7_RIPO1|nr:hypothetical protein [Rippkaea orientalis]ACK67943.1 conserved hypothetical protein [Rippkaea orientalis PCC 8801]